MATNLPPVNENVRNLERKLSSLLESDGVRRLGEIGKVLEQIRKACASAVLQDVRFASSAKLEDRLWSAHQRVNAAFRESLGKLKAEGNSKLVEHRKLGAEYLKYIKSSQKFYRGFIRDLAIANGGIPELERVAKKLDREYSVDSGTERTADQAVERLILVSCHRNLIQLGDLSRYRETELGSTPKNWASAIGFYDLAGTLIPESGIHHNQLAVVATADGQHFRAAYHIYRAISAEEPHPGAEVNLRKMLTKVASQWDSGELLRNATTMDPNSGALVAWYLRLHYMLFKGREFSERHGLEQEVQSQIEMSIKQRKANSLLNRMVLINIAASTFAQTRFLQKPDSEDLSQSYLFFLRQNIQTISLLLRVFSQELATLTPNEDETPVLTSMTERVLPPLRIYSLWLLTSAKITANAIDETFVNIHLELWTLYARCLTLVGLLFLPNELPEVDWLLEEEADTIGFKPLQDDATKNVWERNGKLKPYRHEVNHVKDDYNREMLHRVRAFFFVGAELTKNHMTPIKFDDRTVTFYCTLQADATPSQDVLYSNEASAAQERIGRPVNRHAAVVQPIEARSPPIAVSHPSREENFDADAERMVDSIVGDEGKSTFSSIEPRASRPTGAHTVTDIVNSIQGYSQNSRSSVSPGAVAPFMGRGGSGSKPHSQEQSPALQQQQARLSTSYAPLNVNHTSSRGGIASSIDMPNFGPRSPKSPGTSSRPGTANNKQQANLSPSNMAFRHHRVQSTDSVRSQNSIWAPDSTRGWTTGIPDTMPPNQQQLQGNSVLGFVGQGQAGSKPASPNATPVDSPMLFGAGRSMWSTQPDDSKPFALSGSRVSATTLRGSAPAWNASPSHAP